MLLLFYEFDSNSFQTSAAICRASASFRNLWLKASGVLKMSSKEKKRPFGKHISFSCRSGKIYS